MLFRRSNGKLIILNYAGIAESMTISGGVTGKFNQKKKECDQNGEENTICL